MWGVGSESEDEDEGGMWGYYRNHKIEVILRLRAPMNDTTEKCV